MARARRFLLRVGAAVIGVAAAASGSGVVIYTVTNTNDGGAGSFRQAILDANGTPGSDLIQFAIPGGGVHTIVTFAPLPVTESVLIDGYSQPGSAWNADPLGDDAVLQVELLGQGTDGLVITGGATIVQGLALQGFQAAIALSGASNNLIQGNFIGPDASGNVTFGNVFGVTITGAAGPNRIGDNYPAARNLISGNSSAGIAGTDSDGTNVYGNLIGTDTTGSAKLPNGTGIQLTNGSLSRVGAGTFAARNVISGNSSNGLVLTDGLQNNVATNDIGTTAGGTSALGNGDHGVRIDGGSQDFVVADNIISGNGTDGVLIANANLPNGVPEVVIGNFIGTDGSGTLPIGNGGAGIKVENGYELQVKQNTIANNRVGVWRLPNPYATCEIAGNSMFSNRGLGIVIGTSVGIPPNMPNGNLNFPIITSVTPDSLGTRIAAFYSGRADVPLTIELFRTPACTAVRPGDFVEGKQSFYTVSTTVDGSGYFAFDSVFPVFLDPDEIVTATATITITTLGAADGFPAPATHTSPFSQRLPYSMTPGKGPAAGGTPVTITGTSFEDGATVTIGGQAAADAVVTSDQQITATTPALPPGAAYDLTVTNPLPNGASGTLRLAWVADFLDVPPSSLFYDFVASLAAGGITGGVGGGNYGVANPVLRQQMAVFLLKGEHGICYVPPPCIGIFADVLCAPPFAPWIEALYFEGITGGCGAGAVEGAGNYCPQNPVRRDQMAVFLLKAKYGASYVPPSCAGTFPDVPCPSLFADWIEHLASEGITGGCGGGNYCPASPVTRGQMAVFIVKTFGL